MTSVLDRRGVALVTGAARGIGAAIADMLLSEGLRVVGLARSFAASADVLIEERPGYYTAQCDISNSEAVHRAVQAVTARLGPVEVLINNAGGWSGQALVDAPEDQLRRLCDTMIVGTLLLTRAVLPEMIHQRFGFIVNIGSMSGLAGSRDSVLASVPKAAIVALTNRLRAELRGCGVRVALVSPAQVMSRAQATAPLSALTDDGRWTRISSAQVAEAVRFILSQPENVLIRDLTIAPADAE